MKLYNITDIEFKKYGNIIEIDSAEIIKKAEKIEMPAEGSVYKASEEEFEKLEIMRTMQNEIFGEMPVQIGYCWGHSDRLNALEWHKSSEINIAVTDMILFLGNISEMENGRYNSDNIKAFLLKKGETVEIFATTMHFCPCETGKGGFGCIVVLPRGTNTELESVSDDKILFRRNKWIIAHEDNTALINRGVVSGIFGINFKVGRDI